MASAADDPATAAAAGIAFETAVGGGESLKRPADLRSGISDEDAILGKARAADGAALPGAGIG